MSYLRTNYRISGKKLDIDAIGPAILKASGAGGAGFPKGYGGFILVSLPMSASAIMDDSAGVVANRSGAYTISTYALLSLYYGAEYATEGYRAFPLWVKGIGSLLSVDTSGLPLDFQLDSAPSGSIVNLRLRYMSTCATGTAVDPAWMSMGGSQPNVMAAFFIVSGPGV